MSPQLSEEKSSEPISDGPQKTPAAPENAHDSHGNELSESDNDNGTSERKKSGAGIRIRAGHGQGNRFLSLLGVFLGLLLLIIGLVVGFLPQFSTALGDFPIFVACVGLACILASLGSQATYISGPVSLGGGAAIAVAFFLLFSNLAREKPANSFEGELTVRTPAPKAVSADLWIANDTRVAGKIRRIDDDYVSLYFPLDAQQVDRMFKTLCSRLDIRTNGSTSAIEFTPSQIGLNDYFTVMSVWYAQESKSLYFHRSGIRQVVQQKCAPSAVASEKAANADEAIVRRSSASAPSAPVPVPVPSATPATQVALPSGAVGWSYFGIKPDGEPHFVEKNFDIVSRGQGAAMPSPTQPYKLLKGDILIALTDIRVREAPRRLVAGTIDQWENPPIVGVIKAGEKVKVVDEPRVVRSISHWVPISAKIN